MLTVTTREAQSDFDKLLDAARREPVTVTRDGEPALIVLSVADYERMLGTARKELKEVLARTRAHAAGQGLTEEELSGLLADDS